MKKVLMTLSAVAFVAAFASCKKDYVCECTFDSGGTTITQTHDLKDLKKKDAEEACKVFSTGAAAMGVGDCKLQ